MGDPSGARGGDAMGISASIGSTTDIRVHGVGGTEVQVEGAARVGAAVAMGLGGLGVDITWS